MKSSVVSCFFVAVFALLPFGAWGDGTTTPTSQAVQTTTKSPEELAVENFGTCSADAVENCYQISFNGVTDTSTVKEEDKGCSRGYRYDEVKKKQVWFQTPGDKCKKIFKDIDKKKAEKKKQQASSQPANPANPPVTNPPKNGGNNSNTVVIEVTREEWNSLVAIVQALSTQNPNSETLAQEICKKLNLDCGPGESLDSRILKIKKATEAIDTQIKDLQKQIEDEKKARIDADKKLADEDGKIRKDLGALTNVVNSLKFDGNSYQGHSLSFQKEFAAAFVNNKWPAYNSFYGLQLRIGLLDHVGVHGSVAVDLNLLNLRATPDGRKVFQLGGSHPDLTWTGGFDFKLNDKITLNADIRGVHRAIDNVAGITIAEFDLLGCGGVEASVFKNRHNTALTVSACGGSQADADEPAGEFAAHFGMSQKLWTKVK
jgi:hypothetical protein